MKDAPDRVEHALLYNSRSEKSQGDVIMTSKILLLASGFAETAAVSDSHKRAAKSASNANYLAAGKLVVPPSSNVLGLSVVTLLLACAVMWSPSASAIVMNFDAAVGGTSYTESGMTLTAIPSGTGQNHPDASETFGRIEEKDHVAR